MSQDTTSSESNTEFSDLEFLDMDDVLNPKEGSATLGMELFRDIPLTVTLEVASTQISMGELSKAQEGDVLPLEKAINEPLDVKVNGVTFAKAEVVMVEGKYGLKFIGGLNNATQESEL